jgi:putative membrane fusion protein
MIKKIITFIFFLTFFIFMGVQVYTAVINSVQTETTTLYTTYDILTCDGFLVRDEKIILSNEEGAIDYLRTDGEKVAKDSVVATIYVSEGDIDTLQTIKSIEQKIESLNFAQSPAQIMVSDPLDIEGLIKEQIMQLSKSVYNHDISDVGDIKEEISMLVNRKRLAIKEVENFNDEINELKTEKKQLTGKLTNKITDIKTPISGYFSSQIDGFETLLTPKIIGDLTALDILSMQQFKTKGVKPEGAIGKIITDFEWYFITLLDEAQAKSLNIGTRVQLSFPFASGEKVKTTVYNIGHATDGMVPVGLKSDIIVDGLNLMRHQTVELILNSYTGIRVPTGAVRIVDGQKGVYVLIGSQAVFKPITVIEGDYLYSQSDYVLAEQKDPRFEKRMPLVVSDEVIVKARGLYNGKIVK